MLEMRVLISEVLLIILSWSDIKHRYIDLRVLIIALAISYIAGVKLNATGVIPGIAILLLAYFTHGKIGDGDGYVIGALGLINGFMIALNMAFSASVICATYSLLALVYIKLINVTDTGPKKEIPFVPFIYISYNIMLINGSVIGGIEGL